MNEPQQVYVATRKGLFTLRRKDGAWETVGTAFLGEPVSMVLPDRRDGTVYAALNLGHFGVKFWRCRAGGEWEECAVPTYPPQPEGYGRCVTRGDAHARWRPDLRNLARRFAADTVI